MGNLSERETADTTYSQVSQTNRVEDEKTTTSAGSQATSSKRVIIFYTCDSLRKRFQSQSFRKQTGDDGTSNSNIEITLSNDNITKIRKDFEGYAFGKGKGSSRRCVAFGINELI